MYMERKVRLSDHNFVVGIRHTLIPSVYVVYEIKENGELSYSGNTFIRIRIGKHDFSSAHTHAYDIKELFESSNLPEGYFSLMVRKMKPLVIRSHQLQQCTSLNILNLMCSFSVLMQQDYPRSIQSKEE